MRLVHDNNDDAPLPIWLDCDPGNDDAFAIFLACFSPYFHLLGISTVFGNVLIDKTSHNVLALLEVLKFNQDEIKVYRGSERPLIIDPIDAQEVHGESGIGGVSLPRKPKIKMSTDVPYLEAMRAAILSHPSQVSIVCTGVLTNLAKLIKKYPEVCENIRYVSIMGGAIHMGNISPHAEFNVFCDPHAAKIILEEPLLINKVILTPLNITHTVLANKDVREAIRGPIESPSPIREMFSGILEFYNGYYQERYTDIAGPPVHDPLAVFSLLAKVANDDYPSSCFTTTCGYQFLQKKVKVVTNGVNAGETIIESGNMDPLRKEDGVFIGMSINASFYWENMLDAFKLADAKI